MTFWLLDDGPLNILSRYFDPAWQWPASSLHVMREVAQAGPYDKSGRRQQLLAMRDATGANVIPVHDGDQRAAKVLYDHLRRDSTNALKDLGEDSSIAFCMTQELNAVFVTLDRRAAYVALAELGPARVAAPFDVWFWLFETNRITRLQWDELMQATARPEHGILRMPQRYHIDVVGAPT